MDTERLLAEEDEGWKTLHEVFASVPAERFEEAGVTPEGWSPKDVMFHVGAWLAECAAVLERIGAGSPATSGHDENDSRTDSKNAAWFNMSREMGLNTVRAEFESARQAARRRFGELADPTPEGWSWFEESGPLHYVEHAADLRAWLDRP